MKVLSPTKKTPFWHYMCKCGKPVATDKAWYENGAQKHFKCLVNLNNKK